MYHKGGDHMSEEPRRAIALRYRPFVDDVPQVVAKGERLLADRIIAEARNLGIQIVEDPKLSASLVRLELNQEIPPELYRAVAEVIAFVLKYDRRRLGHG